MVMIGQDRIRRLSLGALSLLMSVMTACTFPEARLSPGEKHLVVHAVLDLGTRNQEIRVSYSDTDGSDPAPIAGMVASITTPDGIEMFAVPDSVTSSDGKSRFQTEGYHVPLDAYGVTLTPGATYTLHVHTPAGDDATGTTTIPTASPVSVPTATEPFNRLRDTLHLSWSAVAGAASYEVRVVSLDSAFYGYQPPPSERYASFTTSAVTLPGIMHSIGDEEDLFTPFSRATVLVSAVDVNYYDYYRTLTDPFTASAPSSLTGALGVFGSMVPIVARHLQVR